MSAGHDIWRMTREEWEQTAQAQMGREQARYRDLCRIASDFNGPPMLPLQYEFVDRTEDRCPVHGSFVLELDGTRRCNFAGCGWVVTGRPPLVEFIGEPIVDYSAITRDLA